MLTLKHRVHGHAPRTGHRATQRAATRARAGATLSVSLAAARGPCASRFVGMPIREINREAYLRNSANCYLLERVQFSTLLHKLVRARKQHELQMRLRRSLLLLLLCSFVHTSDADSIATERTRRAAYTRCLRHCELSAQTSTMPDSSQLKHCFETRCKSLQPDYSIEVPPLLSKDEL